MMVDTNLQANKQGITELFNGVRGRLVADAPLSKLSWFRTGGCADILFEPADEQDLQLFLRQLPKEIPLTFIGVGSNLLVRDGGVRGAVIRLGRAFSSIAISGTLVKAGAGAMDVHVARAACKAGIGGLEFLVGVPGTIGGAVRMNAGAYGREVADVFLHARAMDRSGHIHEITPEDCQFTYRQTGLPDDYLILDAVFEGTVEERTNIEGRMTEITTSRSDSQPIGTRTGGSTFKNPPDMRAWELIDKAGCRGMRIGDVQVSEKHCNFLINHGEATAADIEDLGNKVQKRVHEITGVHLEWEIKRIGLPLYVVASVEKSEKNRV